MSIIIKDSGVHSAVVTLNEAIDNLSPQIANKLVANPVDAETIEMVVKPAQFQFREPTVVAFSGALFNAYLNGDKISPNRMYIFDRGDVLSFKGCERGRRIYLAVAGGIKANGTNVLQSGDELTMCRNYKALHDEIFSMMRNHFTVSWGIGAYSLAEIYLSDNFHIVRRKDVDESVYKSLESGFSVEKEQYRKSIQLKGEDVSFNSESIDNYGVTGGVFLKDDELIIALNDFSDSTEYTHIGTIPSYHMHKLAQKTRGSRIEFTAIDAEHAYVNLYNYEMWKKSLFKAIEYKISKELVKEKM